MKKAFFIVLILFITGTLMYAADCTCAAGCSSITTITTPFTKNGAGEFCYQTSCLGSAINSWNLAQLYINGKDFTNKRVDQTAYPAAINGQYYIYYHGLFSYSHFEITGSCAGVTPAPTPTPGVTVLPTVTPAGMTPEPTSGSPTPLPKYGAGSVWMEPDNLIVQVGPHFWTSVHTNSGTQILGSYEITITYDPAILSVDTSSGHSSVTVGPDGFVSNVILSSGKITIRGSDPRGKGPGTNLNLFSIAWIGISEGFCRTATTITSLKDITGAPIKKPGEPAVAPGGAYLVYAGNIPPLLIGESDNGKTVSLVKGQILQLLLVANPSTGYEWGFIQEPDAAILKQMAHYLQSTSYLLAGAPANEYWVYKSINTGATVIGLKYWRSFEPDNPPLKTFSVNIVVNN